MATVSIVGRPNVGKSALFNRIARERIAIVFDQPGVTRDRVAREVTVLGKRFMLVDTGGIAFDRGVTGDPLDSETRAQAALAVEDSSVCVVVVDARVGITPLDEEVIDRVRSSGIPCMIAANKCDSANDDWRTAEFERFGLPVFADAHRSSFITSRQVRGQSCRRRWPSGRGMRRRGLMWRLPWPWPG